MANCREVTAQNLAEVRTLNFRESGMTALQVNDFSGMSRLQSLWLGENALSELPEGIFSGLSSLQELALDRNFLRQLPENIFNGLSRLQVLHLYDNYLTSLPRAVFSGLNSLKILSLQSNSLGELPTGVFDDVLDTLGDDPRYTPDLDVDFHLQASLGFASTAQIGLQGTTVKARVVLSRVLPVAARVPFSLGGTATADDYAGLSPDPGSGLLFLAGETSKEIVFSLSKKEDGLGKTIILTLGELSRIGLRRSDGLGSDAPFLKSETLLDRPEDHAVHAITIASPTASADVCDRTPQVRDKLMEAAGVSSCEQVTLEHLNGLTKLDLSGTGITELKPDDFRGLDNLTTLWLHDNFLVELPEGVFDETLDTLEDLRLDPNLRATLHFQLTEQKTVEGAYIGIRVWLSRALPLTVRVPYSVGGTVTQHEIRTLSLGAGTGLLFLAGERATTIALHIPENTAILEKTIVLTLGETSQIGLQPSVGGIQDAPRLGTEVFLDRSADLASHTVTAAFPNELSPVCDRTPQVRDALMEELAEETFARVSDCGGVTAADLTRIRRLWVPDSDISTLKADDFKGLTSLTNLLLNENPLSELPEKIFNGLINLEVLNVRRTALSQLPEGVFQDLKSLQILSLEENSLSGLPEGVFHGLGSLKRLTLDDNSLSTLPEEIFNGLNSLEQLNLRSNGLTTLPEGIFRGLNSLEHLALNQNSLTEMPPSVFFEVDNLRRLWLSGNLLTALPDEIFRGLANLEELLLHHVGLNALPETIFDGLNNLNQLSLNYNNSLNELPKGIFDDVIDTLGGTFKTPHILWHRQYRQTYITRRGRLWVNPHSIATVSFAAPGQSAPEGATVWVPVTLDRPLPAAVRIPYTLGFGGPTAEFRNPSPERHSGLLFPAGVTRQEISLTLLKDSRTQGERTLLLSLGDTARIGVRPSDGRGPDALHLDTESLLLRPREGATHTITVFDTEPPDRDPYCLSLWEGAPCSTAASLPHVFTGPLGESRAATEVVITHKDPAAADCQVAFLFHRGTSPAPAVAFNGQFPDRNLFRTTVPRGGATVLNLASPDAGQLTTGALYVFARSPCAADSFHVQGRVLLEDRIDGSIEEMFSFPSRSPQDWLGHGDCRVLTGMFGNGGNLKIASVTAEPGVEAPAGTRLLFKAFDRGGNFISRLSGSEVSGVHQSLPLWEFDQPTTLQMCLDVPGKSNFQLAVTAIGTTASGAKVQYVTEPFITDPEPEATESGP